MAASFRVKIQGQPGIESALNKVLEYMDSIAQLAGRDIVLGKGLRSPHGDGRAIVIEGSSAQATQGGECRQWVPTFTRSGKSPALLWMDGAINGVVAKNMGAPVVIPEKGFAYILAKVEASGVKIGSFDIGVSSANLAAQEDAPEVPPSTFYVLLGTVLNGVPRMTVCHNLSAAPRETRRSSRSPAKMGDEAFQRWYRWEVVEVTHG